MRAALALRLDKVEARAAGHRSPDLGIASEVRRWADDLAAPFGSLAAALDRFAAPHGSHGAAAAFLASTDPNRALLLRVSDRLLGDAP